MGRHRKAKRVGKKMKTKKHRYSKKGSLNLSINGIFKFDKKQLESLINYWMQSLDSPPTPPCPGGIITGRITGWRCYDDTWCMVDTITWYCPEEGTSITEDIVIKDSGEPC